MQRNGGQDLELFFFLQFNYLCFSAREMAQPLKESDVLIEDPGSDPGNHMVVDNHM